MISIIVCSVDEGMFKKFSENISETAGVPVEIIRVDNSSNKHSICSAYNYGMHRAKYDFLCFSHEDIILRTLDWGKKLIEIFNSNSKLGLLGIAGSTYKAYAPSGWGIMPELRYVNLVQHYKTFDLPTFHDCQNPKNQNLSRVVCIDGVWMCTRKEIAMENKFDEAVFNGFHCYDLDFCLKIFQNHEVAVTFEILLEHFSEGRNDSGWVRETMKLHRKWRKDLPVNIDAIGDDLIRKNENAALMYFLNIMVQQKFSIWEIMRAINYNKGNKHISKQDLYKIQKWMLKDFIKRKLISLRLYRP